MTKQNIIELSKIDEIMQELDNWVSKHGDGKYVDEDGGEPLVNYMIPEDSGIQQVRREIEKFVSILLEKQISGNVLEVGFGYFGSTHFLWRQLFNRVISVEKSHERIRLFGENTRNYYGKWILDDDRSSFLIGMSNDTSTLKKAYNLVNDGIDMLFLDGDHKYESILADYLLYSPMVKKGGIIAFHDCAISIEGYFGVPEFLDDLSNARIDGTVYDIEKIVYSKYLGIAYFEKK